MKNYNAPEIEIVKFISEKTLTDSTAIGKNETELIRVKLKQNKVFD